MGRHEMPEATKVAQKWQTVELVKSIGKHVASLNATPTKRPPHLEERYPKLRGAPIDGPWLASLLLDDPNGLDGRTQPPGCRTRWSSYASPGSERDPTDNRMAYQKMRDVADRAVRLLGWDPGRFWYLIDPVFEGFNPLTDVSVHAEIARRDELLLRERIERDLYAGADRYQWGGAEIMSLASRVAQRVESEHAETERMMSATVRGEKVL